MNTGSSSQVYDIHLTPDGLLVTKRAVSTNSVSLEKVKDLQPRELFTYAKMERSITDDAYTVQKEDARSKLQECVRIAIRELINDMPSLH